VSTQTRTGKDDLRLIAPYLRPYRAAFITAAICCFIESSLELYIPVLMSKIVDVGVAGQDVQLVFQLGAQMVAIALLAGLFGFAYAHFAAKTAMGFGAALRQAEYEQLQRFSFSNLDDFETSSLVTRLTTDVTVIQNALTNGARPMFRGPVMLVMGLVYAYTMSTQLALVFVAVLPALAITLAFIVHRVAPRYGMLQHSMDRLNDTLQEDFVAIRAIKAYVREGYVAERFEQVNQKLAKTATRTFGAAVVNIPVFQAAMDVTSVALLWFGGQMVMAGTMGVGTLTGFMSYVLLIMNSLMMISNVFLLLARAITSIHRVAEVISEKPQIVSPEGGKTKVQNGEVTFKDVSFKYSPDAEKNVLEHVNLNFPAGSTVGILGGTGSGKTTLVQLVDRLYDTSEGAVLVGGTDVRDYDVAALRDGVGMVLQNNVLFSGTVRQNLLWGNREASDEELLEACRLACADEFLDRIGGLDGDLGHGGSNVSGGQRQRLCIARALLKRPKVMIFDDSTSAVDMATDARIHSNLAQLGDMTKIIIAQRVASVMEADQIVVLEDGRVHATGTHEELLASDDIYRELYESQIGSGIAGSSSMSKEAEDAR
jgi:ATP-binding cassette subfamily B multidrug efflux pump